MSSAAMSATDAYVRRLPNVLAEHDGAELVVRRRVDPACPRGARLTTANLA
jgi:hypothetical protein